MFQDNSQEIIDLAKDYAFSSGYSELSISALLAAVAKHLEAGVLLGECVGLTPDKMRAACPDLPDPISCPGTLPLSDPMRDMLICAKNLASEVPDRFHPGLVNLEHLVCALAMSRKACGELNVTPIAEKDATLLLATWYERETQTPRLEDLTERLRGMRAELLTRVFGQDHAIHAFVEGLFNAEVVSSADSDRRAPRGLFVFAGPPGVGKTFLAELCASYLGRPFKRFDMSSFSGEHQLNLLVGMGKAYKGAHPGQLTEFVEKNPGAVLLFDEIEKSHIKTIQLFLQILDAGTLEDHYHERNVSFRDTTIIFTTNAGRKLYDAPNESGVHAANAAFHRKTILDALETEKDPQTQQPFFPSAICSRMATGYPILFNHLRVNELQRVVQAELVRMANLLERQYYKQTCFDELLSTCLVLREGARADARMLRSQTETFVKTEIFKFCQLFKTDRLGEVFDQIDSVQFELHGDLQDLAPEVWALFHVDGNPRILLIADSDITDLYLDNIAGVDWFSAATADDALQILVDEDVDMVLLDLWLGRSTQIQVPVDQFDHIPAASRRLDKGQEALRKVRERLPSMPVFLLSLADPGNAQGPIDDELFMACVRGGGARGMLVSQFADTATPGWENHRDHLADSLVQTCRRFHREKAAERMGQERKVLSFDTIPDISDDNRQLAIRLRNLRLTRAVSAADTGEILEDVQRPRTTFKDVIGADAAKDELEFFIDYLKNPKRFAAMGLTPPKGVLLHGPPGTGKTMLARAMAGESNVAFIPTSATSFVTLWQGSGPQNIRDLFARARRYAPAIVFIDEIDAIGKTRSGTPGAGRGEEMALNALLTEMDGFSEASANRPVFLLAATNFKVRAPGESGDEQGKFDSLDDALVRRFTRRIKVDLPERAARESYLTMRLENRRSCNVTDTAIKSVAERSPRMSIANLAEIVELAARNAVKAGQPLTDALFEDAFETVRFGEAQASDPEFMKRCARHEAGHTLMYWLSGWWASNVTVVARGHYGGAMSHCAEEAERSLLTYNDILDRIRVNLGGRVAEMEYYGQFQGLSTGIAQDLSGAKSLAKRFVDEYGMDPKLGLYPSSDDVGNRVRDILDEQLSETVALMKANRHHLDTLSEALLQKERLSTDDLKSILPPISSSAPQP